MSTTYNDAVAREAYDASASDRPGTRVQKIAAEGRSDLGDLTATVLAALNTLPPEARLRDGGITLGLVFQPQRNIDEQRVGIMPVPPSQDIGKIDVAALFPRLLDQRAARTLPATQRMEGLAALLTHGLVTEAEAKTLESLLNKGSAGQTGKMPNVGKLIADIEEALGEATGQLATTILKTMLVVAKRQQAAGDTSSDRWITEVDYDKMFGGALGGAGLGASLGALGGPQGVLGGALVGFVAGALFSGGGPKTHYVP